MKLEVLIAAVDLVYKFVDVDLRRSPFFVFVKVNHQEKSLGEQDDFEVVVNVSPVSDYFT